MFFQVPFLPRFQELPRFNVDPFFLKYIMRGKCVEVGRIKILEFQP